MTMTKLISFLTLLVCFSGFSQVNSEQQEVLDEFGLSSNDHRGVVFTSDQSIAQNQFPNGEAAIIGFFGTAVKRDLTNIYVIDQEGLPINQPLSVLDLVDLYIELTNENQIEENEE